jgi:uncharacterized membrane protein YcaP (DUF421 family)
MDTVLRVAFVYGFLIVALRVMGKRELGKMSPIELVMLLLVPELFQQALVGEDFSMTTAIVAVSTLFTLVFAMSMITHRFQRVEKLVSGEPAVLVRHGKLVKEALDNERVSPEELFAEMHAAGVERLEQVRWAILEDGGKISIIAEPPERVEGRKPEADDDPV